MPPRDGPPGRRPPRIGEERRRRILSLLASGAEPGDVAEAVGVGVQTVYNTKAHEKRRHQRATEQMERHDLEDAVFREHWVPRRTSPVLPAQMPGSTIAAPTYRQLTARR